MKKLKKWFFPFSFSLGLLTASCTSSSLDSNKKEIKDYEISDITKFKSLISKYNKDNNIQTIYDPYFTYFWSGNTENKGKFKYIFDHKYELITSEQELDEKFLNKFSLETIRAFGWRNHLQTNLKIDLNTLTQQQFQQKNREKFKEIYLNNEDIDKFFKTKNLLMYESWTRGPAIDEISLVVDDKNKNQINLHFNVVDTSGLGVNYDIPLYNMMSELKMDIKYLDKTKTITINPELNNDQTKQFYEYLKNLYKDE
ncbi:hypothetical protein ACXYRP_03700 [Mycoplasma sp. 5912]